MFFNRDEAVREAIVDTKNAIKEQMKGYLPELARRAVEMEVRYLADRVGAAWLVQRLEAHPEDQAKGLLFLAFVSKGADPNMAMRLVMGEKTTDAE